MSHKGKRIWGYWDCVYCESKAIRGDNAACPNCGRTRGEEIKFYMKSTKDFLTQEENSKVIDAPDWLCTHCGSYNSATRSDCKNCSSACKKGDYHAVQSSKNSFKTAYIEQRAYGEANAVKSLTARNNNFPETVQEATSYQHRNAPTTLKTLTKPKIIAIFLSVIALLSLITVLALPAKEVKLSVVDLPWERAISIENLRTYNESDWSLPPTARLQRTEEEVKSYRQEFSHNEVKSRTVVKTRVVGQEEYVAGHRDMGNGVFEEIIAYRDIIERYSELEYYEEAVYKDVPVYATKYYYEIDRWRHARYVRTSRRNSEPYWGEVVLTDNKEREGRRSETYTIVLSDGETTYNKKCSLSVWSQYSVDDLVIAKVKFGRVISIDLPTVDETQDELT